MAKAKKITKEELKKVVEYQNKLNEIVLQIGHFDHQKFILNLNLQELNSVISSTKEELEKTYGSVNIDLTDGSYTKVEKDVEDKKN